MKKITKALFLAALTLSLSASAQDHKEKVVFGQKVDHSKISPTGHVRCATDEYQAYLKARFPKMETQEEFEQWLAPLIQQQKAIQETASQSGGIIYIPVVVHVIHNGDAYGTNENITDEQVQSQITVMTQDFRRMMGTPGYNTNAVGADTQVEFVLAKVDPNGNPTNGINRVNLCAESWSTDDIDATVKPTTIWDPTLYMNMWSVNFQDNQLLGYAQFPFGSTLGGLNMATNTANTDGVVAGYRFFGSSSLASGSFQPPYDKGRTMTHEVGHFLGLRHIWGDSNSCTVNATDSNKDYCPDTPAASAANYGCTAGTNSCTAAPGNDMIENYMDYTDDTCMNIFTNDQKTRITTVLNNSPRRASLKTSTKDIAIALFANDAEVKIENYCSSAAANPCSASGNEHKVLLYNRGTANLTSASINYNVNGGTNNVYNWSGNLAPNKYAMVSLTTPESTGTFNVAVASANGGADARTTNNTASKAFTFTAPATPTNYDYTTYTFTLVGDRYGSETTWNLKNAAGTVLYSGGPYTDLGTNTTQNLVTNQVWNLPSNGCYAFTISDSYGDGINGGFGAGSWTIKTNSGATTVGSGGNFTRTENKYFTNNATMSAEDFTSANGIVLFPNPATNEVNIKFAQGFDGNFNYSIYNNLGQVVKTAQVVSQDALKINTAAFSNGVYFIKIEKDGLTKTLRFIKN